MQQYKKILGKVMMTAEGAYNSNKGYDPISLVTDEETGKSYISRQEVPVGTQINNREYWQPVASSGIIDNGVIILNRKNSNGQVPIYDLKSATEAVAIGDRKGGVILGFLGFNPETDTAPTWKLYQYNDVSPSNWTNIDYWLPMDYTNKYAGWFDNEVALYDSVPFPKVGMYAYVGNSVLNAVIYRCYNDRVWQPTEDKAFSGVVNLADEEDITSNQNKLKFKDKEYNPAQFSGLGKLYLRKNVIDGKNILTQTMMQATNTIYIIQYDYDLQGETITIPKNCTLQFEGGSFTNGKIIGNESLINATSLIFKDIEIEGSWSCQYIHDRLFNYVEGDADNNTRILNGLFSLSSNINNTIIISNKYKYIPVYNSGLLVKSNTIITGGGEIYVEPNAFSRTQVFRLYEIENVIIDNITLIGEVDSHLDVEGEWNFGIYLLGSRNITIKNCVINNFFGDGIDIQKSRYGTEASANEVNYEYHNHNILIENCIISKNRRNNISIEAAIDITISKCKIFDAGIINGTSPKCNIDIEPIIDNNQIVKNIYIDKCIFYGAANKDIVIPVSENIEGILSIKDCELDTFVSWNNLGDLNIDIINTNIKKEGGDSLNIYTKNKIRIINSNIKSQIIFNAESLNIVSSYINDCTLVGNNGEIFDSSFGLISLNNSHNIDMNNCHINSVYVHSASDNIRIKNSKIKGRTLLFFNGSIKVSNISLENCDIEQTVDSIPFTGIDYISENCWFIKCNIKLIYTGESWIPFDNFIDCNITVNSIKIIHNNAYFENCSITINNPIKLLDIDNASLVEYIFKNTSIYTNGVYISKSSNNYSTFVEVIDGNIDIYKLENLKLSNSSIINTRTKVNYNYYKYIGSRNTLNASYAVLVIPKINIGWIKIKLSGSNRYQSVLLDENINISIYSSTITATIEFNSGAIDLATYNKLIYPKLHTTTDNYYIVFECVNGKNADLNILAEIYSNDGFDTQVVRFDYLNKTDANLIEISTDVKNIIKDSLSNLKRITKISNLNLINGYSTDYNKPLWHNGTAWIDAMGATV